VRPYRHRIAASVRCSALALWLAAAIVAVLVLTLTVEPLHRTTTVRVRSIPGVVDYQDGECIVTAQGAVLCRSPII